MRGPRAAPLEISRREASDRGIVVLSVSGDLVLASREALGSAVEAEAAAGARRVVVDLGSATHVDMPAFALLVRLHERCEEKGVELVVAALPESFQHVSLSLRLPSYLRMTADVEAALAPGA